MQSQSFDLHTLRSAYLSGELTPMRLVRSLLSRIETADSAIWITTSPPDAVLAAARALEARAPASLPLYGIPFAVKDNIDVAGMRTTAGCPAFAYVPERSAPVVERLLQAGAILVGKTNLDQFATGLVGVRSPYGVPRNSFHRDYVPGGSSSGSAVAVATGLVSFALGTDTAGSGRVPAAFNNIVGLKPTRGAFGTRGVVPACRTLDCVSVFALSAGDAEDIRRVCESFDGEDAYARKRPASAAGRPVRTVGVPDESQLAFFGDEDYRDLFAAAVSRLGDLGITVHRVDYTPFHEAAALLYGGPWLAERYLAVEPLLRSAPEGLHPVTRAIVAAGREPSAADAFRAAYRLADLARAAEQVWEKVDALMTPTAGTIYSLAALEADPIGPNTDLGYYTNHVNLLDMCALAVPGGFRGDGLPFGVTLSAPAWHERELAVLGDRLHRAAVATAGATGLPLPPTVLSNSSAGAHTMPVAVCGAHMSGMPLNRDLVELGARFRCRTDTAPAYRLYALAAVEPARPGLVRVPTGGVPIELEVWDVPEVAVGRLLAGIRSPLGLGQIELADGSRVHGFLCETAAAADARDITVYGGWRAYRSAADRALPNNPTHEGAS